MSAGIFNQVEPGQGRPAAHQSRLPVLQFRRHRRRHLQDRSSASRRATTRRAGHQRRCASRIVDLMFDGKPIDPSSQIRRRHQQLPRRRRRHFPGIDGSKIIYAAPDTNRDVIVRYIVEPGTINPAGRRQLVVRAARRHDRDLRDRPQGQGPCRRRQGRQDRLCRRRRKRLRQLPHHAVERRGRGPPPLDASAWRWLSPWPCRRRPLSLKSAPAGLDQFDEPHLHYPHPLDPVAVGARQQPELTARRRRRKRHPHQAGIFAGQEMR